MDSLKLSQFSLLGTTPKGNHYVANTLTGAIIELEESFKEALHQEDLSFFEKKDVLSLKRNGIIINSALDEIGLLRAAYSEFCHSRALSEFIICPTLECNFNCPYCFEERQAGHMSATTQKAVVDYIRGVLDKGTKKVRVDWFGGEPLLYPSIIKSLSESILKLCNDRFTPCDFTITTNGYLIDENIISLFSKFPFVQASITLDGDEQVHNSRRKLHNGEATYQRIVENIYKLASNGIYVKVRVNIDKSNPDAYNHVKKLFGKSKNIFHYPAVVTKEPSQTELQQEKCYSHDEYHSFHNEMFTRYGFMFDYRSIFKRGVCSCMAEHVLSCVIDPEGNVYKCVNDVGHPSQAIESVYNVGKKNPCIVSKYLGRDPMSEIPCKACKYLPLCYGGCVYELYRCKEHICSQVKYTFKKTVAEKIDA